MIAATIARHWPFANGSGRILDRFAKGSLGTGETIVRTSDGFRIYVLRDDLIGRHIALSGKFDRSIVQVLLNGAKPGDVLLDIGANIGYFSACFLSRVPNSRTICVEPQPVIVDLLRKNVAQFDGRSKVIQIGLADHDGKLRFHVNTGNRGASRVSDDGEIEIPVRDAGEVLKSLDRVDLIKIDVEGMEEPIFRSMKTQLERLKPRAILFEDQGRKAAPGGAIGSILTRSGYEVFGISKRLLKTGLVPIRNVEDCRFNDYLGVLA